MRRKEGRERSLSVLLLGALLGTASACAPLDDEALHGPEWLSATGLYTAPGVLAPDVIPFSPSYELWSDGAKKRRFLALPKGSQIDTSDMNAWRFPVGTRAWKEFELAGRRVETRYLEKRREPDDGGWFQMSYVWQDNEIDALAAPGGSTAGTTDSSASSIDYVVPAQEVCGSCHYRGERPVLGISAIQLGGGDSTGMAALISGGHLSAPPTRTLVPPGDAPTQAALGYLHANCSHCHDARSSLRSTVKIFMNLSVEDTSVETTQVYQTLVDKPVQHYPNLLEKLIAPGKPEESWVRYRMALRGFGQMPPIATRKVDPVGLEKIDAWIVSLAK